jgi:predicted solute-binding protein
MKKQSTKVFTLGHSPDPDDAFMFYAMAENKIDLHGYRFDHRLEDIQTLNERARRGELHISAISIHAYAYVADKYALLPCGASMGDGYGPVVVRRRRNGGRVHAPQPVIPSEVEGSLEFRIHGYQLPAISCRFFSSVRIRNASSFRLASASPAFRSSDRDL